MNEKVFAIVFIVVTVVAVAAIMFSRSFVGSQTENPSESPTPQPSLNPPSGQTASPSAQVSPTTRKSYSKPFTDLSQAQLRNKKAIIETAKGNIEFEVYPEATKAATNFISLANDRFFDGLAFHRVEPGFVIQGGDPVGNGTGGPGYTFKEEKLVKDKYDRGVVAMAKKGNEPPGTGGSQFFIMLDNKPLPLEYVIFGKVIKGQSAVDKIVVGDVMTKVTIAPLK